jgi:hypothetical protein
MQHPALAIALGAWYRPLSKVRMQKPYEQSVRFALRAYKLTLSPLIGQQCRFHPTCSEYAAEALITHGPLRGGWLAARRVCRCNPWGGSGLDPVPPARVEAKLQ